MKVCFIAGELFSHGKYGGFGSLTRTIGRELVKRGVEVFAVVPRRGDQKPREVLDGITVLSYPKTDWAASAELFRQCDCDIYHSEEPNMGTVYAQKAMPERVHLVTFQDPRDAHSWWVEFKHHTAVEKATFFAYLLFELNPMVKKAVRRATRCFSQAKFVAERAKRIYGLDYTPGFLPNPVALPERTISKSVKPEVLFLGRWDPVKRVHLFFELSKKFSDVRFTALGKATDPAYDRRLRRGFAGSPNFDMPGFIDQFADMGPLAGRLESAWILCNTSAKECLPVSFLEGAAYRCAILSHVDPDGFASERGYHAADGDFAKGLRWLLENDNWATRGLAGYEYVRKHHEMNHVIDLHLETYRRHLNGS
jgi:glycosyltransferase involved in cell wall biosynthesis